ncbi:MAG: acyl carrier protein [Methylomicrobium sp.]|nr:acyl carrier protein [Methylomicrobium sp.]
MDLSSTIKRIISTILQLDANRHPLDMESPLLGAIPEFDSMAVVSIITALEDEFGFFVDDDEIDASVFETVGTLHDFVKAKLEASSS